MNSYILAILIGVLLVIIFRSIKTKDKDQILMIQEKAKIINMILVEEKRFSPIFAREVLYFMVIEFKVNGVSYRERFPLESAPQFEIGEKVTVFKSKRNDWQLIRS